MESARGRAYVDLSTSSLELSHVQIGDLGERTVVPENENANLDTCESRRQAAGRGAGGQAGAVGAAGQDAGRGLVQGPGEARQRDLGGQEANRAAAQVAWTASQLTVSIFAILPFVCFESGRDEKIRTRTVESVL